METGLYNFSEESHILRKTSPPETGLERMLLRQGIIGNIQKTSNNFSRSILFAARCGQGKSQTAAQILNYLEIPWIWYNIDLTDHDFTLFADTFCQTIGLGIKDFSINQAREGNHREKQTTPSGLAVSVARELKKNGIKEICFIFDNMELLSPSSDTFLAILSFLEKQSIKIDLFLISSRCMENELPHHLSRKLIKLGEDDLAMSRQEIALLYNQVLKQTISLSDINYIYAMTQGWPMGVVSLRHWVKSRNGVSGRNSCDTGMDHGLPQDLKLFFRKEVVSSLGTETRLLLETASLLPVTHTELISYLARNHEVESRLQKLAKQTLFITWDQNTYTFHPLLKKYLRYRALRSLKDSPLKQILSEAVEWLNTRQKRHESLEILLVEGNFKAANEMLKNHGLTLVRSRHINGLQHMLAAIPKAEKAPHPYLVLYSGITGFYRDPVSAMTDIDRVSESFLKQNDHLGFIIAAVYRLKNNILNHTNLKNTGTILSSIDHVVNQDNSLPRILKLMTKIAVIQAHAFIYQNFKHPFPGEIPRGPLDAFDSEVLILNLEEKLFLGNMNKVLQIMEPYFSASRMDELDMVTRMHLKSIAATIFFHLGQEINHRFYKKNLQKTTSCEILESSHCNLKLECLEIERHIMKGSLETPAEMIDNWLERIDCRPSPHFTSILLQYRAYAHAMAGETAATRRDIKDSFLLRSQVGGEKDQIINHLYIGGAYSLLGLHEEGLTHLDRALSQANTFKEIQMTLAALFHRAHIRCQQKDMKRFREDITHAIYLLKSRVETAHVRWVPDFLLSLLLKEAHEQNIERDFINSYSEKILHISHTRTGSIIPMWEINTLGSFFITCEGKEILNSGDLTRIQIEIISILVSSPDKKINIQDLQMVFWPDSPSKKGRTSLNVTINRLRSTISQNFTGYDIKNYIHVKGGELHLSHCIVDTDRFTCAAAKGIAMFNSGNPWQASNMFRYALSHYSGEFFPCITLTDRAFEFKENKLQVLYLETVEKWSMIIMSGKTAHQEDLHFLERALGEIQDNPDLAVKLYIIYSGFGDIMRAEKMLGNYAKMLKRQGYSTTEAQETISYIKQMIKMDNSGILPN